MNGFYNSPTEILESLTYRQVRLFYKNVVKQNRIKRAEQIENIVISNGKDYKNAIEELRNG